MTKDLFIALGFIGAIIILYGATQNHTAIYYLIGGVALLTTAVYFRLLYFIALQLILFAGLSGMALGSGPYTLFYLPILLCFQLFIFYIMYSKENSILLMLGIIGIALLSIGFAYNHSWIYLIGCVFVATYSYYSGYKGMYASYIWALLNTFLAFLTLYRIFS